MAANVASYVSSSKTMGVVTNISVSYVDVPSFSDLADKADLEYVKQQINSMKSALDMKTTKIEEQTSLALMEFKESFEAALNSKERIECEKKELVQLFDILSAKLQKDCQTTMVQLDREIKAYHEIDKSLNERLSKLYNEMQEYIVANNNAATTIDELSERTKMAEEASKKLTDNPNMLQDLAKKVKDYAKLNSFLFYNVILIDIAILIYLLH